MENDISIQVNPCKVSFEHTSPCSEFFLYAFNNKHGHTGVDKRKVTRKHVWRKRFCLVWPNEKGKFWKGINDSGHFLSKTLQRPEFSRSFLTALIVRKSSLGFTFESVQ